MTKEEQVKEQYKAKWEKIALDTTPTDEVAAEKYFTELYAVNGLAKPHIMFVDNPVYGARIADFTARKEQAAANGLQNVLDFVQLGTYKTERAKNVEFHGYGQLDAYWLVYWDYVKNEEPKKLSKDDIAKANPFLDLAKEVNYYWLFDRLVIVSRKPKSICVENDKLHSLFTPALEFGELEIYAIEGEVMKKEEWMQKTAPFKSDLALEVFKKLCLAVVALLGFSTPPKLDFASLSSAEQSVLVKKVTNVNQVEGV